MTVKTMAEQLGLTQVTTFTALDTEITGGYCSDLLSNVMGQAESGMVWITMQGHRNIAAVGTLIGLAAIIITGDAAIEEQAIAKAQDNDLPLYRTELSSYEVAGRLYALLTA